MASLDEKVATEFQSFLRVLPQLRAAHDGEWVVFLGTARYFATDERAALRWAHANVAIDAGYVVACVEEPEPVLMTAALAYRLGA